MKGLRVAAVAALFGLAAAQTALAGEWVRDDDGLKYKQGSDYVWDQWLWLDRNGTGVQECFYFGRDEYLVTNGLTPDDCTVNANGAWTVDGVVQTKLAGTLSSEDRGRIETACAAYYYCKEYAGLTGLPGDGQLTESQKDGAMSLATMSTALGLYPLKDVYQQDGRNVYDGTALRQILYDLYGFELEHCTSASSSVQHLGDKYYIGVGDFGMAWPYCSLTKTEATADGFLLSGTTGDASDEAEALTGNVKKNGTVYQEQRPITVKVVYNATGTYCRYRIQEVNYQ